MGIFVKRSNIYKVRDAEYKPWNLQKVIETYAGRPYEEVLEEHRREREEIKR